MSELSTLIEQINIMGDVAEKENYIRGNNLKKRANDDLERIARSAWLNLYEHLSDKGINPDDFLKKN